VKLRLRRDRGGSDGLPPTSRTQRLLVTAAAVAITLTIGLALVSPHLDFLRARSVADPVRPCAPGQTRDCVGGTMGVIAAPSAASASAASSARH
jgi:hypothetical protein